MRIILASSFNCNEKDGKGVRFPIPLTNTNSYLSNLKNYISKYDSVVVVANNPISYEITDMYANFLFASLDLSDLKFKNKTILDNRNKKNAKTIIENANLIFLSGGKLECQLDFFAEIGLRELIKNHNGLIIGGSAGAMNLCNYACNFPEALDEVNSKQREYFLKGLGFHNELLIPHFDGKKYDSDEVDVLNKFILPLSQEREFIAFDDDSYIVVNNGEAEYFGSFYKIKDGKIRKQK